MTRALAALGVPGKRFLRFPVSWLPRTPPTGGSAAPGSRKIVASLLLAFTLVVQSGAVAGAAPVRYEAEAATCTGTIDIANPSSWTAPRYFYAGGMPQIIRDNIGSGTGWTSG